MKTNLTVPAGWRLLGDDELIKTGDKFDNNGGWIDSHDDSGNTPHAYGWAYIRKMEPVKTFINGVEYTVDLEAGLKSGIIKKPYTCKNGDIHLALDGIRYVVCQEGKIMSLDSYQVYNGFVPSIVERNVNEGSWKYQGHISDKLKN